MGFRIRSRSGSRSMNEMSPAMQFFFSRLFPWPFILVGAGVLFVGVRDLGRAKESGSWPTASGVVQHSSVESRRNDEGGRTYHAEIVYDFTVRGITYSGTRVAFGDYGSGNPSHARSIVNRYRKGKEVRVYYRAEDPEVCVLEPGVKLQAWILPVFGLVFFAAGSCMAVFLPKVIRKHSAAKESSDDEPLDRREQPAQKQNREGDRLEWDDLKDVP